MSTCVHIVIPARVHRPRAEGRARRIFEAYRALGFHAAYRFFGRRDRFAHLVVSENPCVRDDIQLLDEMFPLASKPDPCWPRGMRPLPATFCENRRTHN
jgi:hypothetical protein